MSNNERRVLLPGERFMRKNCARCHRRLDTSYEHEACKQCRDIATMIVESCAMNLALLPDVAFRDAECEPLVIAAVSLARAAFQDSGITPAIIDELRTRIQEDVREGIQELQDARGKKGIIQDD